MGLNDMIPILEISTVSESSFEIFKCVKKDKTNFYVLKSNSQAFKSIDFILLTKAIIDEKLHFLGPIYSNARVVMDNTDINNPTFDIKGKDLKEDIETAETEEYLHSSIITDIKILYKPKINDMINSGNLFISEKALNKFNIDLSIKRLKNI